MIRILLLALALAVSGCAGYSHVTDVALGYWSAPR